METNVPMEIQREQLLHLRHQNRPMVYYVHPNVFQIFFKRSLIRVFQQFFRHHHAVKLKIRLDQRATPTVHLKFPIHLKMFKQQQHQLNHRPMELRRVHQQYRKLYSVIIEKVRSFEKKRKTSKKFSSIDFSFNKISQRSSTSNVNIEQRRKFV